MKRGRSAEIAGLRLFLLVIAVERLPMNRLLRSRPTGRRRPSPPSRAGIAPRTTAAEGGPPVETLRVSEDGRDEGVRRPRAEVSLPEKMDVRPRRSRGRRWERPTSACRSGSAPSGSPCHWRRGRRREEPEVSFRKYPDSQPASYRVGSIGRGDSGRPGRRRAGPRPSRSRVVVTEELAVELVSSAPGEDVDAPPRAPPYWAS